MKIDYSEVDKMLGDNSDSEISEKTGIDRRYIWRRRKTSDNQPVSRWDKYKSLLGTMKDGELGAIIGISGNAVTRKRIRTGIQPFAGSDEMRMQKEFVKTLQDASQYVTTPTGNADIVDKTTIYELKFILTTNNMHTAIGQLLSYSHFIKNKKLCIVTTKVTAKSCLDVCYALGISIKTVTFD